MTHATTTWLVTNAASGSNDEQAVARLVAALEAAGHAPARILGIPDDPLPDRGELDAAGVELLAIFAGDGTANAAVKQVYGWGGRVLALPGGTQNLFARSCHGDAAAEAIVERLGQGALQVARRNLVRSRHGDGLCEIVAGPGATWSEVREAIREGAVGEAAAAAGEAIRQSAAGPMVQVAEPALGKPEGYAAVRLHPADGALAVDGYGAEGVADYAKHGVALLKRNFREGPHDELGHHRAVVCRSEQPIALMIDGERADGGAEERFELAPCEVDFLVTPVALREAG